MALQDKFDSAFTEKLLKKTLISGRQPQNTAVTANDNNYELTKSNLITISNSFTSLQNAFNKMYSHSLNIQNLHQYDEKRMVNIKKENNLENKIAPNTSSASITNNTGDTLASTASTLDSLASSVEKLNDKMKKVNLSGSGYSNALLLGNGIDTNSRSRMGRIAGGALGVAGAGLDVYGRYQGGQSSGQIATGVGGGLAGAALGAKGGALAGGAIGALFGGVSAVPGAAIGGAIGGIGGYFAGSLAGDAAYNTLNRRASGGGVKAGGTYVVGERGPEVLMLGGMSGKVIANGQRRSSPSDRYLAAAADKSSRAAAKVSKGQPLGPTSYSTKFSNYLSSLFGNMPNWLNRIKDYLGFGKENDQGSSFIGGEFTELNASEVSGSERGSASDDWRQDTSFITAVNNVARQYNFNPRTMLALIASESGFDPRISNKNGATGLFQFMPAYHDTAKIAQMSRSDQVNYMADYYLKGANLPAGATPGQLYSTILAPSIAKRVGYDRNAPLYSQGTKEYNGNAPLDKNRDGAITIADLDAHLTGKASSYRLPGLATTSVTRVGGVGVLTSGYGMRMHPIKGVRKMHEGIDIGADLGTNVASLANGKVTFIGMRGSYGNLIIITQDDGVEARYAHLDSFTPGLSNGARVNAADVIGKVGSSGGSTGAHLHLELRRGGSPFDPLSIYNNNKWIVGGTATPEQRTPTTGLPAGYRREGRADAQRRTTVPYIITPNGSSFPASVTSAQNITNFNGLNSQTQNEILAYFRLK